MYIFLSLNISVNIPVNISVNITDGAAGVPVPAADRDRVWQHPGPHHPALPPHPPLQDELLHHAPRPGRPQRGAALRLHGHRVEGDDDLGGRTAGLQADQVPPGGRHLRLHLRPGGPQYRQIRRHHPPHGFHRKL